MRCRGAMLAAVCLFALMPTAPAGGGEAVKVKAADKAASPSSTDCLARGSPLNHHIALPTCST